MARRHPRLHWQKTQSCGVHAWRQLRCRVQVWPHKHLGVAHQWCKCQVISARHRGCFWFLSRKTILASMMLSQFMWHERCLTPSIAPLALWLRILFDGVKVLKNGYRIHQGAWIGAEQGIVPPRLPQPQHRSASRPLPCLRSRPGACGTHAHTHTHTHTHTENKFHEQQSAYRRGQHFFSHLAKLSCWAQLSRPAAGSGPQKTKEKAGQGTRLP